MSFPIFHLLAEVQIRGHFYWALKGTLSLGFNMKHGNRRPPPAQAGLGAAYLIAMINDRNGSEPRFTSLGANSPRLCQITSPPLRPRRTVSPVVESMRS